MQRTREPSQRLTSVRAQCRRRTQTSQAGCPADTWQPWAVQLRGWEKADISFSLSRTLVPIPCPLPCCLLQRLLAATHGTQGSHLAPMVVLRAKEISDCGVSIIDNKAPRTLITLLPYVLKAHNQVRRRRTWKYCISSAFHRWVSQAQLPSYCSCEIPLMLDMY